MRINVYGRNVYDYVTARAAFICGIIPEVQARGVLMGDKTFLAEATLDTRRTVAEHVDHVMTVWKREAVRLANIVDNAATGA